MIFLKWFSVLLTLVVFSGTGVADDLEVSFATGEWPPFSSRELPENGSAAALVTAVCKAAHIKPVYTFYPWRRAELKVKYGQVFAAFPYAMSVERNASFDYSDVLFYGLNVFIYYQKNDRTAEEPEFTKLDDLRGYRIGGISGSFLQPMLLEAGLDFTPTTTIDQSLHKLVAGRVDLIIDDRVVLNDAVQRLYPGEKQFFKRLPKPFGKKTPTALLVSRDYPNAKELLEKFNKGLSIIKQNGEYDRIIDKYHMTR